MRASDNKYEKAINTKQDTTSNQKLTKDEYKTRIDSYYRHEKLNILFMTFILVLIVYVMLVVIEEARSLPVPVIERDSH